MKLAILSAMGAATWGGSEELWSAMALRAVEEGHQVASYLRRPEAPHPKIERLRQAGVAVQFCPPFRPRPVSVESITERAKDLVGRPHIPFQELLQSVPDVLLVSEGGFFSPTDVTGCAKQLSDSGKPYFVVCCSTDGLPPPENLSPAVQEFYTHAESVSFACEATARVVQRQLAARIPRVTIIRSPMDLPDRSIVPWLAGEIAFASVGSLETRWKGQDILLEALSGEQWKARPWRLSLFGEGPDRAYLSRLIQYYELSARVTLAGYAKDIRAVWASHHALVLPSRQESAPQVVSEAMLCGRPVIATDANGVGEWLDDGQSGFIAEAASARSFQATLERAWLAREEWKRMGERAHLEAHARLGRDPAETLLEMMVKSAHGDR